MYKLLVVDDEQIVLDSIKFIVNKNFEGVVSVSTARSGREAIEIAEALRPDIIIMDISMPGINGIEAIKEIKNIYRNVIFYIITAYDQFEFAKEAVGLGVYEYLLKPVNRMKIVEIINKSIDMIQLERNKRRKELELKEKLESVIPVLENGFIYSILFFEDDRRELYNYKEFFKITKENGFIMTVEFGEDDGKGKLANKIGLSVRSQSFYPYFRDSAKCVCNCIIGPVMFNRIIVFVIEEDLSDEYTQRLKAMSTAEQILEKIIKKTGADFYIGIGKAYKGFENLSRSYEESIMAIKKADSKGVMHYMDLPVESGLNVTCPATMEKLFFEKVYSGDLNSSLQKFNQIYEWLQLEYGNSMEKIKTRLIEIMVILHRALMEYGENEADIFKKFDYIGEILSANELMVLKAWCRDRIKFIVMSISIIKEKRLSKIVIDVKKYIEENFNSEISLDDVSRIANMSPNYFCKTFKNETGVSFIEYLTLVRVQKAKEFLEGGKYSVKEICFQVGYGDPNYFSKIFKKVVGITPTEYKDGIQARN